MILHHIILYHLMSGYFIMSLSSLAFPLPSVFSNSFPLFSSMYCPMPLSYLISPYLTLPYQLILINPVVSFTFFKLTNICSVGDLNHTSTDTGMRMGSGSGIDSGSPLIQGQGRGHGVDDKNALLASTFLLSPFPLGSRSK